MERGFGGFNGFTRIFLLDKIVSLEKEKL